MAKQKVVILRQIPTVAEKLLGKKYLVEVNRSGKVLTREQLYRRIKGAAAIIPLLTDHIDKKAILAAGPNLKIVANYAVGYDNLDLPALKAHNIVATNTPGRLTESVAEHALALTMGVARRVLEGDRFIRDGKYKRWEPMIFYGQPLIGKTVGVIGTGRIGGTYAALCHHGLRMKVLYHDVCPNEQIEKELGGKRVSLRMLVKQADVISLHVPLLPSTRHLIDSSEISYMKKTVIIINTSRGPVIDEAALVKALHTQRIFGAGLDVFEFEPKLAPGLVGQDNVIMTPHIASATEEARDMMAEMAAQNVLAVLSGNKPLNPIA